MKHLGEKSLSSWISKLLGVLLYLLPIGAIFVSFIFSVIFFATPVEEPGESLYSKFNYELFTDIKKDDGWQEMKEIRDLPPAVRLIPTFLIWVYVAFLFLIVKTSKIIFDNFKSNIVFSNDNVLILSKLTKLVIIFSVISFNLSSFLLGIMLLILSDILKSGTALQEEHDLTV